MRDLSSAMLIAGFLLAAACGEPEQMTGDAARDTGVVDGPAYQGATAGGTIPDFSDFEDASVVLDAGTVVVDQTCCPTTFRIDDQEPSNASGVLESDSTLLGEGVPLTRADGEWSATVCLPLHTDLAYWFHFSWSGGAEGETIRINDAAPTSTDLRGMTVNHQPARSSCGDGDGGQGDAG